MIPRSRTSQKSVCNAIYVDKYLGGIYQTSFLFLSISSFVLVFLSRTSWTPFPAFRPFSAHFLSDHFPRPLLMSFRSLLNVHPILCSFLKSRQALLPRVIRLLNCAVASLGLLVFPSSSMLLSSSFFFHPGWLAHISPQTYGATSSGFFSLFFSVSFSMLFYLLPLTTYSKILSVSQECCLSLALSLTCGLQ